MSATKGTPPASLLKTQNGLSPPAPDAGAHRASAQATVRSLEAELIGTAGRRRLVVAALLALIIGMGVCIRMASLPRWLENSEQTIFQGKPLLTNYDGYYYLSLARDLIEGRYDPIDTFRGVPDHQPRPVPPPMLSALTAFLNRWTPLSLNWAACLLPALLGPLLALPLYGLGRLYGGAAMGLCAAFLSVLSVGYLGRTHFGWFDTDCLNVTLAVAAVYFFLKFARATGPRRYGYLAGGFVVYALFLWWWDQAPLAVTGFVVLPMAAAIVFADGGGRRHLLISLGALAALCLLALLQMPEPPWEMAGRLWQEYGPSAAPGPFPSIGESISELRRIPLKDIVSGTTGTWTVFVFSTLGLVWLFVRHPRDISFFAPLIAIAALCLVAAGRLIIFLVPVLCLGAGFICARFWSLRRDAWPMVLFVPLFILFMGWLPYYYGSQMRYLPNLPMSFVTALDDVRRNAPKDAVVWAWWDHGYPIRYWADRATVNDGSGKVHVGERSVYTGIPLAAAPRLAANFMQFYVTRGIAGIHEFYRAMGGDTPRGFQLLKEILAAGPADAKAILEADPPAATEGRTTPEEWVDFFFPASRRPVLLLMEGKLAQTAYWWFWFGTWDVASGKGIHPRYTEIGQMVEQNGRLVSRGGVTVDRTHGLARLDPGRPGAVGLWELTVIDGGVTDTNIFPYPDGPVFQYLREAHLGALMDRSIAESVFNRLFARRLEAPPYLTLWGKPEATVRIFSVQGDHAASPGQPDR